MTDNLKYESFQFCAHCLMLYSDHVNDKCLFDAGTFEPQFYRCKGFREPCTAHIARPKKYCVGCQIDWERAQTV